MSPNGPVQGCTRLGGHVSGPVRSDPHGPAPCTGGMVHGPRHPHLEATWCPKHAYMCGTPNGAQWPCTRLHKVGWACVGPRPRSRPMHTVDMPSMGWGGWMGGWVDGAAHTHTHICMAHICKRGPHTHTSLGGASGWWWCACMHPGGWGVCAKQSLCLGEGGVMVQWG